MAEQVKGLKGKLTLKKLLFKDDGETRRTWEKDGKVYFLEFVKFDVNGKEYSGECMTTKKEGSAWEEGKEYSFDFKEADNPQYNHRIFNIKDPNAPAGNFGGGGKGNYETAAERAQRQKFIIAQSSMERAIEILGVGKSVEEYKPLADMIFAYVLDKGGELKEAAAAVELPKLDGAPLQGILSFVTESVTQKSLNEGAAKLVKVLFGIQRYELTDASAITIAKKLLEPIYSAPAPAQSNNSSSDITTIAGSHGAIENEGSDDLPF